MSKKRTILRILYVLVAIIAISSVISYVILMKEKEWMAFYLACCGGVLILNLIMIIIFVNKNLKK